MKITLEIPDTTVAAFFDFVYATPAGMRMQGHSMDTDELQSGRTIIVSEAAGKERENG